MAKLNYHISGHGNEITQENKIQLIEFERARTHSHTEKKTSAEFKQLRF